MRWSYGWIPLLGLALVSARAYTCSYDGMPLDLALAHPASLTVALAARQAYQDAAMPRVPALPGGFGMRRALMALDNLRQRLPADTPAFSLLLAEPGLWSRFADGNVTLHSTPVPGERLVIVSEGALLALEKQQLSSALALQRQLLIFDGPDGQSLGDSWQRAFAR